MSNDITTSLGIAQIIKPETTDILVTSSMDKSVEDDFDYARQTMYVVMDKTKTALNEIISLASQAQSAKAYEVLNALLRTLSDQTGQLTDLHIKKKRIDGLNAIKEDHGVVNNNLFVGSTAELQKMLDDIKTKNET